VGTANDFAKEIYDVVLRAQKAGVGSVGAGALSLPTSTPPAAMSSPPPAMATTLYTRRATAWA